MADYQTRRFAGSHQQSSQSSKIDSLTQDIALIKHFRDHLSALSDVRVLDLLSLASTRPVNNADARSILKVGKTGAWFWIDKLRRLSMLDNRNGHQYRTTPYTSDLVYALSLTFRSVLNGRVPRVERKDDEAFSEAMKLASLGLETLWERGKIDQDEYERKGRMLKDLEKAARQGDRNHVG